MEVPGRPLTEMDWRVGRAIYEATPRKRRWDGAGEAVRLRCLQRAHDAIAAMREPTEAMVVAGGDACLVDHPRGVGLALHVWRAMIAAALEKGR